MERLDGNWTRKVEEVGNMGIFLGTITLDKFNYDFLPEHYGCRNGDKSYSKYGEGLERVLTV